MKTSIEKEIRQIIIEDPGISTPNDFLKKHGGVLGILMNNNVLSLAMLHGMINENPAYLKQLKLTENEVQFIMILLE